MSFEESDGEIIWREFHENLGQRIWKASILGEGYYLFKKAVECFDFGAIEGTVLLCRATLESSFLMFLSLEWHSESAFNIVYPMRLDGKLRQVGFPELQNAMQRRVPFSSEQVKAIERIHTHGNFMAHAASRKIKQRVERVEKYKKWDSEKATQPERLKKVRELILAETHWITKGQAFLDLSDTSSIMLTLCNTMGKNCRIKNNHKVG